MAIVINEFEVMVEPPPAPQPDSAAQQGSPTRQAQPMRPDEIVTVMQVHEERLKRVRAN
jgi:hypothetical protein